MKAHQLKNAILQLAVQGKLVPQNPNDEPASKLLERIAAEKRRRIKAGEIKKDKRDSTIVRRGASFYEISNTTEQCIDDELPFDLPKGWEWARLGAISTYCDSKQKVKATNADASIWGLDLEDIEKGGRIIERKTVGERKAKGDKTVFEKGDILYSKLRPYLLKILVAPDNGICTSEIVPFKVYGGIIQEYVVNYLKSPYIDNLINSITYGVKMPRVGTETMTSLLIPIPPLAEQRRIVDRLESLLPLVEAYGKAEAELSELDARFPDMLKKSILQDAVQGKLVPQNPNDEPASVLLERIRAEKQRLIKEGKIKKDKHESVIFRRDNSHYEKLDGVERCIDGEIPFEIPDNWGWVRLGTVFQHNTGKALNASNRDGEKLTYITTSNLYWDRFVLDNLKTMPFTDSEVDKCTVQQGDLLVCEGGDIGRAAIWERNTPMRIQNHIHRLRAYMPVCTRFFYYLFYLYKGAGWIGGKGIAIQGLSSNAIHNLLFPLPPLAEQHRIVSAIDKALNLVQKL